MNQTEDVPSCKDNFVNGNQISCQDKIIFSYK